MGYGKKQIRELQKTINRAKAEVVIDGTPSDIKRLFKINKPVVYAGYDINEKNLKPIYRAIDRVIK